MISPMFTDLPDLAAERFGAAVALRIGLVHEVTASPGEAVGEIVEAVLAGGPEAVRAAKSLARQRPTGRETAEIAAARRTSEEGQAGLRAFQDEELEQSAVVVNGKAPFFIVVTNCQGVFRPSATVHTSSLHVHPNGPDRIEARALIPIKIEVDSAWNWVD